MGREVILRLRWSHGSAVNQILTKKELYFPYGHLDIVDKEKGK